MTRLALALAVACTLAACFPEAQLQPIDGTSRAFLGRGDDANELPVAPSRAARIVIDKLNARGFALVRERSDDDAVVLELAGNRDSTSAGHTIGSMFRVTISRCSSTAPCARVTIVGKPVYDHQESCPSLTGDTCRTIHVWSLWALTGWDEARVISGVLAEMWLDLAARPAEESPPGNSSACALCGSSRLHRTER